MKLGVESRDSSVQSVIEQFWGEYLGLRGRE